MIPYKNITAVSVVWNEGHRIAPLAAELGMWFENIVIVVQESTDNTLDLAKSTLSGHPGAIVISDEHRGGGDFSMPLALSKVKTPWTFVISGDEFPDFPLLDTMGEAVESMEAGGYSGTMIRFEEYLDGVRYIEHEQHVRLFRTAGGWEARHHSAASHENLMPGCWQYGRILHRRTLSEACADYLRKLTMMEREGEQQLADHNRYAIFAMCGVVANEKGWRHVWNMPEWSEVERRVFSYAETPMEVV